MTPAVRRRYESIPEFVTLVDDDGTVIEGCGEFRLPPAERLMLAECSLKWKQSLSVTFNRMVRSGLRSLEKR